MQTGQGYVTLQESRPPLSLPGPTGFDWYLPSTCASWRLKLLISGDLPDEKLKLIRWVAARHNLVQAVMANSLNSNSRAGGWDLSSLMSSVGFHVMTWCLTSSSQAPEEDHCLANCQFCT